MLVEKTVQVPATTRTVTDHIKCELCAATTADERNWTGERFTVSEVTIVLEVGSSYPEGGSVEKTIIDMCPGCFETKLLPWLRQQGGSERKREIDF